MRLDGLLAGVTTDHGDGRYEIDAALIGARLVALLYFMAGLLR